jgi:phenylacetic acid degradation operon negative regulatory protein
MTDRVAACARALVTGFRRQRPVRAGSLLVTIFGDCIAPRGGTITLASLIRLAEPFGITERLVRTSVGRLTHEGWLAWRRSGRQSEYFLSENGRQRFAEATRRIYSESPRTWDEHWTLLLLPQGSGAARERAREEMSWLGFGQLGVGVLAHPNLAVADARQQVAALGMDGEVVVMRARSEGAEADRRLAAAGWDLGELGRSYRRFVSSFTPARELVAQRSDVPSEPAFVIRTLLVHEYRKIHLRDPLLPRALLPGDWIGEVAYELCRDLYRAVFAAAEAHISATAATLDGALGRLENTALRRFGGLRAR